MKLRTRFFISLGLCIAGLAIVFLSRVICNYLYTFYPEMNPVYVPLGGMLIACIGLIWGQRTIRCPHCGISLLQHNLFRPCCPNCGTELDWKK